MDRCPYLLLITDDSCVAHQPLDVFLGELGDFGKGELCECLLEIKPLVLDHGPVKSCCENSLGQSFEILSVVLRWFHAPPRHVVCTMALRYLCSPLLPGPASLT